MRKKWVKATPTGRFVEVMPLPTESPYLMFSLKWDYVVHGIAVTRDEAEKLRDWLNEWLETQDGNQ